MRKKSIQYFVPFLLIMFLLVVACSELDKDSYSLQSSSAKDNYKSVTKVSADVELHDKALKYAQEGKYEEALSAYREALKINKNNIAAKYDYAKTLSKLKQIGYPGYFDAEVIIFAHLDEILDCDEDYRLKIEKDLYDILKDDFRYYKMIGYDIRETEDSDFLLRNLKWYIRSLGSSIDIYGQLEFNDDNTFRLWYYTPESIISFGEKSDKYEYTGTYSIINDKVTLNLSEVMLLKRSISDIRENVTEKDDISEIKGILNDDGGLKFDIFEYTIHWQYPANG